MGDQKYHLIAFWESESGSAAPLVLTSPSWGGSQRVDTTTKNILEIYNRTRVKKAEPVKVTDGTQLVLPPQSNGAGLRCAHVEE